MHLTSAPSETCIDQNNKENKITIEKPPSKEISAVVHHHIQIARSQPKTAVILELDPGPDVHRH